MRREMKLLTRLLLLATFFFPVWVAADDTDETPVVTFVGDREVNATDTFGVTVRAYSSRPGVPWLWAESLPEGADFFDLGDGSRVFLWYPGPAQVGEHTVTFIAADAQDQSLRTRMDVTVTVLPGDFTSPAFSIVAPSNAEVIAGNTLSVVVFAVDSDGSVPALIGYRMPQGATLDDNGDGTRTFNWTPSRDDVGIHHVQFSAHPVNYPNSITSHDMWVNVVTRAPLISFPVSPGVIAGQTLSFPVSVTKPSGNVPALMIDALPGNASFTDNGDGSRQFVWETTDNDVGSYNFTITALDTATGASSDITLYINVLPDPSLAEGDQLVLVSGRIDSLDIGNVDIEEAFEDSSGVVSAMAGFLRAETDLIINGDDRRPVTLLPGLNAIVVESTTDSQRIVVNIRRASYPEELYPAIAGHSAAVDVDDTTVAIGDTLYELDDSRVVAEHVLGSEIGVYYVTSVDISNSTVAMASRERPQEGVWLYERTDGIWEFDQHLVADPVLFPEGMGSVVALDGDTLAVAAVYDSGSVAEGADREYKPGAGAVLIYERLAGVWTYSATLRAPNAETNDYFGHSLALEGDTLVVGAIGEDSSGTGVNGDLTNNEYREDETELSSAGAAYVFERADGDWELTAYLKPSSNVLPRIGFGHAVAVFEDMIAVSALDAPRAGDEAQALAVSSNEYQLDYSRTGNVFVYERDDTGWTETTRMSAPADNWRFGLDIDVKKNQVLVLTQTQAYLHERIADAWQLIWNRDVGAGVTAFNDEAMVFGVLNNQSRVFTSYSPY